MSLTTDSVNTGQFIMKYLIAFTLLFNLLIQLNQGLSEIIKTSVGTNVYLNGSIPTDSKLLECIVVHNDNVNIIYPEYKLTDYFYDVYKADYNCNFWLYNVNFNHAGKWALNFSWLNDDREFTRDVSIIELYIYEETYLLPKNEFTAEVGNYLTIFPQNVLVNVTNCTLIHYDNETPIETYDLMNTNQTNLGLELYEKCGMRLLINESRYGMWNIIQNNGPYKTIKLKFNILKLEEHDTLNEINLVWTHENFGEIRLANDLRVIYCKIIQPDGRSTIIQNRNCAIEIYPVKNVHEGIWEIQYLIPEKIRLVKKIYKVHVIDELTSQKINVTVNRTNSQIIHLLCTRYQDYMIPEFCIFTKPDGTIINLPQSIGNDKYEYYGNGYTYQNSLETYSDCGLTIREPSADDFGLWQCTFGNRNHYSAYIPLINTDTTAYEPNEIYVKLGDPFSIECPQYSPLKYCQLYHTNNAQEHKHTRVFGERKNRSSGICSKTIQNATHVHAGYWSCLLGAVGKDEIKIPKAIKVIVTESYLHPNQSEIDINKNKKTTLTMNLLPKKYATIDYCRWKRPDGHGIHVINNNQYSTTFNQKSCSLTINEYNEANIGIWTCYASLYSQDSNDDILDEEIFATITVSDNNDEKFLNINSWRARFYKWRVTNSLPQYGKK